MAADVVPIVRTTLFVGELMHIGHVVARPVSAALAAVETQPTNVIVFPLAGVFAKHDGPRRQFIATARHAVIVPSGTPYRVSFPGGIGDRCLTLRVSSETLEGVD